VRAGCGDGCSIPCCHLAYELEGWAIEAGHSIDLLIVDPCYSGWRDCSRSNEIRVARRQARRYICCASAVIQGLLLVSLLLFGHSTAHVLVTRQSAPDQTVGLWIGVVL